MARWLIIPLACLAASANAWAQGGRPVQDGRALDANPQLGSGGFNLPAPSRFDPYLANRIITGNVRGLGRFHAVSPVDDPTLYRAGLGSAGLSFFERRSVALEDVLRGTTAAGLPYYGRAETIVNTRGILGGQNVPGSSQLRSTLLQPSRPFEWSAYEAAARTRDAAELQRTGQLLSVDALPPPSGARLPTEADVEAAESYARATVSPVFGTQWRPPLTPEFAEDRIALEALLAARREALAEAAAQESPADLTVRTGTPTNLGRDAYTDLFNALRYADAYDRQYVAGRVRERIVSGASPSLMESLQTYLSTPGAVVDRPDDAQRAESAARFDQAAQWARRLLDAPVTTFTARQVNQVNAALAAGEQAMQAGRYYDAAESFARGEAADPNNPLPRIARGHALLAAGDYVSAVRSLEAGLQRFPRLAALRLDLNALLGGEHVLKVRVDDLKRQLLRGPSVPLEFLLGYVLYYSGQVDEGLGHLLAAAAMADPSSVIARFPYYLSGQAEVPRK